MLTQALPLGAPADPDIAALWERINREYHANQEAVVRSLAEAGALHVDAARATDVLWTLNHPNTWQMLVRERGWTPEEYERWSADAACAQLLGG